MVERLRFLNDRLTAADQALYEMLLANARRTAYRDESKTMSGEFEASTEALRGYLPTQRWDDIEKSVSRLNKARIEFAIRTAEAKEWGELPLVAATFSETLKGSVRSLVYSFTAQLVRLMDQTRNYALLELGAFPRFTSKYSPRLYPLFARRAGYDEEVLRPFEIAPEKLAEILGWDPPSWSYANFRKRCLDPALADVGAHVRRFIFTEMPPEVSPGRGRQVLKLRFLIEPADKQLNENSLRDYTRSEEAIILHPDIKRGTSRTPSRQAVYRTSQAVGRPIPDLLAGWHLALDEAETGVTPDGVFPVMSEAALGTYCGKFLLDLIASKGLDEAFYDWARQCSGNGRFMQDIATIKGRRDRAIIQASAPALPAEVDPVLMPVDRFYGYLHVVVDFSGMDGETSFSTLNAVWDRNLGPGDLIAGTVATVINGDKRRCVRTPVWKGRGRPVGEEGLAALRAMPGVVSARIISGASNEAMPDEDFSFIKNFGRGLDVEEKTVTVEPAPSPEQYRPIRRRPGSLRPVASAPAPEPEPAPTSDDVPFFD